MSVVDQRSRMVKDSIHLAHFVTMRWPFSVLLRMGDQSTPLVEFVDRNCGVVSCVSFPNLLDDEKAIKTTNKKLW